MNERLNEGTTLIIHPGFMNGFVGAGITLLNFEDVF